MIFMPRYIIDNKHEGAFTALLLFTSSVPKAGNNSPPCRRPVGYHKEIYMKKVTSHFHRGKVK